MSKFRTDRLYNDHNGSRKRLTVTLFDLIWAILIFYSFWPENAGRNIFWVRYHGVPISYIPFFIIFTVLFLKNLLEHLMMIRNGILIKHGPIGIFLLFLLYIPIQLCVLLYKTEDLFVKDYLIDYIMFCFYGVVIFYSVTIYFRKANDPVSKLNCVFERSMKYLFIICIISLVRYVSYDIHYNKLFFNLFYPLGYRLFEVLFLSFFSALTLGWYFTFKRKIYLAYFVFYGIALIISGSRTGYIAYALIVLYLIIRMNFRFLFSSFGPVIIITIIAGTVIGGEYIKTRAALIKDLPLFSTLDFEKGKKERRSTRRLGYWVGSLKIFKDNPYFGVGIGKRNFSSNFPLKYKRSRLVARPHNTYLYFLASTGIVGISLLTMFWLSILKQGYKSYKSYKRKKFIAEKTLHLLIANILILVMQFGYQFETGPFVWIFWAISFSWFNLTISQHKPSRIEAKSQLAYT